MENLSDNSVNGYRSQPADSSQLSEFEPTEQMVELQQDAQNKAERAHTDRDEHDGEVSTEDYSVSEAISKL